MSVRSLLAHEADASCRMVLPTLRHAVSGHLLFSWPPTSDFGNRPLWLSPQQTSSPEPATLRMVHTPTSAAI
eukprot:3233663-Rhodomonas_salina.3